MNDLSWHDLQWALRRCPRNVLNMLKTHPGSAFVAGGFLRSTIANEPVNDIDVFAATPELAKAYAQEMAKSWKIIETCNTYTIPQVRPPIQVIHRWTYTVLEDLLNSFDFTIASAAMFHDGKSWRGVCHPKFYEDLAAKRLVYMSPQQRNEDAGGSLLRVLKFYQRGYRIPLDSFAAVIARLLRGVRAENDRFWLTAGDIEGDAASQRSVDDYRTKIMSGLLREVDPNLNPNSIAYLPALDSKLEPEEEVT